MSCIRCGGSDLNEVKNQKLTVEVTSETGGVYYVDTKQIDILEVCNTCSTPNLTEEQLANLVEEISPTTQTKGIGPRITIRRPRVTVKPPSVTVRGASVTVKPPSAKVDVNVKIEWDVRFKPLEDINSGERKFYDVHLICRNTNGAAVISVVNNEAFPVSITLRMDGMDFPFNHLGKKSERVVSTYKGRVCSLVQNHVQIINVET